jgi:hypothetical protein
MQQEKKLLMIGEKTYLKKYRNNFQIIMKKNIHDLKR